MSVIYQYESDEGTEASLIEAGCTVAKWANKRAAKGWELVSFSVSDGYVYAIFRRPTPHTTKGET